MGIIYLFLNIMKSFIAATLVVVALAAPVEYDEASQCQNEKIRERKNCDIKSEAAIDKSGSDPVKESLAGDKCQKDVSARYTQCMEEAGPPPTSSPELLL